MTAGISYSSQCRDGIAGKTNKKILLVYIFFHGSFYVDGLIGHHEVFADISLGSSSHLRGGILDFANNKASSVPAKNIKEKVRCVIIKT